MKEKGKGKAHKQCRPLSLVVSFRCMTGWLPAIRITRKRSREISGRFVIEGGGPAEKHDAEVLTRVMNLTDSLPPVRKTEIFPSQPPKTSKK
jgi:hypothetical protein